MNYFAAAFIVSWVVYFSYLFFIDRKLTGINKHLEKM